MAKHIELEFVEIPAGTFLMGANRKGQFPGVPIDHDAWDDEMEMKEVWLNTYLISKYEITNWQWGVYAAEARLNFSFPRGEEDYPVVNVSAIDAEGYCAWLTTKLGGGYIAGLPNETEWEKAARGTDGRIYPWGNEWDKSRCNTWESGIGRTTPVNAYPNGVSPYGVWDMSGNVWEWTSTPWDKRRK